ncbi:hypothetical protein BDF21DRAFT_427957 [Thamnidium elegans]|nr:hypothetical protein BDF21DRAFT_427957 [Thamnidium elegans]
MTPFTTAENRIYNYLHLLQVVPQSVDYSRTGKLGRRCSHHWLHPINNPVIPDYCSSCFFQGFFMLHSIY